MTSFDYRAAKLDGELVHGRMDVASQDELVQRLQSSGHIFISASPAKERPQQNRNIFRRSQFDIELFTFELAALMQAELTLPRALELLARVAETPIAAEIVNDLEEAVRGGASFADALEAKSSIFGSLYIAMMRAGEASGQLSKALQQLAKHLERSRQLRETLTSALIYPSILLVVALATLVLMLTIVVPRFAELFADAGQTLPLATRLVVAIGEFLSNYGWLICVVTAGAALLARKALTSPKRLRVLHKGILSLPLVGPIATRVAVARFARTLATLIDSGDPVPKALPYCVNVVGNAALAYAVEEVARAVRSGESLADAMSKVGVFPVLAQNLVKVGEETGSLPRMLGHVADLYENEVKRTVTRAVTYAEPAIIVMIGGLVGAMIYSIISAVLAVNEVVL
jgi:general secretion pathway protein F